jgi:hypothetical protein
MFTHLRAIHKQNLVVRLARLKAKGWRLKAGPGGWVSGTGGWLERLPGRA